MRRHTNVLLATRRLTKQTQELHGWRLKAGYVGGVRTSIPLAGAAASGFEMACLAMNIFSVSEK